jgi:hypothetical protein
MLISFQTLATGLALLCTACAHQSSEETTQLEQRPSAQKVFKTLSSLEGKWRGVFDDGREHQVTLRLSAGGSALVETWALSPTRESITIYNLDGDRLLATHYCPQGNQPRLELKSGDASTGYNFEFLDGTGLQNPDASHQHQMWIKPIDREHFERSEVYISNTKHSITDEQSESIRYTRIE